MFGLSWNDGAYCFEKRHKHYHTTFWYLDFLIELLIFNVVASFSLFEWDFCCCYCLTWRSLAEHQRRFHWTSRVTGPKPVKISHATEINEFKKNSAWRCSFCDCLLYLNWAMCAWCFLFDILNVIVKNKYQNIQRNIDDDESIK